MLDWSYKPASSARRGLASFLAVVLLFTLTVEPWAQSNLWEQRRSARQDLLAQAEPFRSFMPVSAAGRASALSRPGLPAELVPASAPSIEGEPLLRPLQNSPLVRLLPLSFATIQNVHLPASRPQRLIIHIQDVHGHLEAQKNIARSVLWIQDQFSRLPGNQGSPCLVGLEGASGPFLTSTYRAFPDKAVLDKVASGFLSRDLLTGAEYAALTSPVEMELWGVEDRDLYLGHVRALRSGLPRENNLLQEIKALEEGLQVLKSRVYPVALRELDRAAADYHRGGLALGAYVELLGRGTRPERNTAKFLEALSLEKDLDFPGAERERRVLVETLSARLGKEPLSELVDLSAAFWFGQIGYKRFYGELSRFAHRASVPMERFPEFLRYVRYVGLVEQIDRAGLLEEIPRLEEGRARRLLASTGEVAREVYAASKDLAMARGLVEHAFSDQGWKDYQARRKQIHDLPRRIASLGPSSVHPAGQASAFGPSLKDYEDFYTAGIHRNAALVENLLAKIQERPGSASSANGPDVAVLVTGGFHSPGIQELLRQKNIAYVTLTPRIKEIGGHDYLDVFRQDKTPLERLAAGEKLTIVPELGLQAGEFDAGFGRRVSNGAMLPGALGAEALLAGVPPAQVESWLARFRGWTYRIFARTRDRLRGYDFHAQEPSGRRHKLFFWRGPEGNLYTRTEPEGVLQRLRASLAGLLPSAGQLRDALRRADAWLERASAEADFWRRRAAQPRVLTAAAGSLVVVLGLASLLGAPSAVLCKIAYSAAGLSIAGIFVASGTGTADPLSADLGQLVHGFYWLNQEMIKTADKNQPDEFKELYAQMEAIVDPLSAKIDAASDDEVREAFHPLIGDRVNLDMPEFIDLARLVFRNLGKKEFDPAQRQLIEMVIEEVVDELYTDKAKRRAIKERLLGSVHTMHFSHIFPRDMLDRDFQSVVRPYAIERLSMLNSFEVSWGGFVPLLMGIELQADIPELNTRTTLKHELVHYLAAIGEIKIPMEWEQITFAMSIMEWVKHAAGTVEDGERSLKEGPAVEKYGRSVYDLYHRGKELGLSGETGFLLRPGVASDQAGYFSIEYLIVEARQIFERLGLNTDELLNPYWAQATAGIMIGGVLMGMSARGQDIKPLAVLRDFFAALYQRYAPLSEEDHAWIFGRQPDERGTLFHELRSYASALAGQPSLEWTPAESGLWDYESLSDRAGRMRFVPTDLHPRPGDGDAPAARRAAVRERGLGQVVLAISRTLYGKRHLLRRAGDGLGEAPEFRALWDLLMTPAVVFGAISKNRRNVESLAVAAEHDGAPRWIAALFRDRYDIGNPHVEEALLTSLPLHLQFLDTLLYRRVKWDGRAGEVDDPRLKNERVRRAVMESYGDLAPAAGRAGWGRIMFDPRSFQDRDSDLLQAVEQGVWPAYRALYDEALRREELRRAYERMIKEDLMKPQGEWDEALEQMVEQFLQSLPPDVRQALEQAAQEAMEQQLQNFMQGASSQRPPSMPMPGSSSAGQGQPGQPSSPGQPGQSGRPSPGRPQTVPSVPGSQPQGAPSIDNLQGSLQQLQATVDGLERQLQEMASQTAEIAQAASSAGNRAGSLPGDPGDRRAAAEQLTEAAEGIQNSMQQALQEGRDLAQGTSQAEGQSRDIQNGLPSPEQGRSLTENADEMSREAQDLLDRLSRLQGLANQLAEQAGRLEQNVSAPSPDEGHVTAQTDGIRDTAGQIREELDDVRGSQRDLERLIHEIEGRVSSLQESLANQAANRPQPGQFSPQQPQAPPEGASPAQPSSPAGAPEQRPSTPAPRITDEDVARGIQQLTQEGDGPRESERKRPPKPLFDADALAALGLQEELLLERMTGLTAEQRREYEIMRQPLLPLIENMTEALKGLLGLSAGMKLDLHQTHGPVLKHLVEAVVGEAGYARRQFAEPTPVKITFMIDASGSMDISMGGQARLAAKLNMLVLLEVLFNLNEELERKGFRPIEFEVGVFSDDEGLQVSHDKSTSLQSYQREKIIYELLKKFDKGGGTRYSESLGKYLTRLIESPESGPEKSRRLMFVISDEDVEDDKIDEVRGGIAHAEENSVAVFLIPMRDADGVEESKRQHGKRVIDPRPLDKLAERTMIAFAEYLLPPESGASWADYAPQAMSPFFSALYTPLLRRGLHKTAAAAAGLAETGTALALDGLLGFGWIRHALYFMGLHAHGDLKRWKKVDGRRVLVSVRPTLRQRLVLLALFGFLGAGFHEWLPHYLLSLVPLQSFVQLYAPALLQPTVGDISWLYILIAVSGHVLYNLCTPLVLAMAGTMREGSSGVPRPGLVRFGKYQNFYTEEVAGRSYLVFHKPGVPELRWERGQGGPMVPSVTVPDMPTNERLLLDIIRSLYREGQTFTSYSADGRHFIRAGSGTELEVFGRGSNREWEVIAKLDLASPEPQPIQGEDGWSTWENPAGLRWRSDADRSRFQITRNGVFEDVEGWSGVPDPSTLRLVEQSPDLLLVLEADPVRPTVHFLERTSSGWRVADVLQMEDRSSGNVWEGQLVELTGETGLGKGELMRAVANLMNEEFFFMAGNRDMEVEDLYEHRMMGVKQAGVSDYLPSAVSRVSHFGGIVMLDEYHKIPEKVRQSLKAAIAGNTHNWRRADPATGDLRQATESNHPRARIVASSNILRADIDSAGVTDDQALQRRKKPIQFAWLPPQEEVEMQFDYAKEEARRLGLYQEGWTRREAEDFEDDLQEMIGKLVRAATQVRLGFAGYRAAQMASLLQDNAKNWNKLLRDRTFKPANKVGEIYKRAPSPRVLKSIIRHYLRYPQDYERRKWSTIHAYFNFEAELDKRNTYPNIVTAFESQGFLDQAPLPPPEFDARSFRVEGDLLHVTPLNGQGEPAVGWDPVEVHVHPRAAARLRTLPPDLADWLETPENCLAFYRALQSLSLGRSLIFVGEQGTGKSTLAGLLQEFLSGPDKETIPMTYSTSKEDIAWKPSIGEHGVPFQSRFTRQQLPRAMNDGGHGKILVVEEATQARPGVIALFNEITENRGLPIPGGGTESAMPGFGKIDVINPPTKDFNVGSYSAEYLERHTILRFNPIPPDKALGYLIKASRKDGLQVNPKLIGEPVVDAAGVPDPSGRWTGLLGVEQYIRQMRQAAPAFLPRAPDLGMMKKLMRVLRDYYDFELAYSEDKPQEVLLRFFIENFNLEGKPEDVAKWHGNIKQAFKQAGLWSDTAGEDGLEKYLDGQDVIVQKLEVVREPRTRQAELDAILRYLQENTRGNSIQAYLTRLGALLRQLYGDWDSLPFRERLKRVYILKEVYQVVGIILQERGEAAAAAGRPAHDSAAVIVLSDLRRTLQTILLLQRGWPEQVLDSPDSEEGFSARYTLDDPAASARHRPLVIKVQEEKVAFHAGTGDSVLDDLLGKIEVFHENEIYVEGLLPRAREIIQAKGRMLPEEAEPCRQVLERLVYALKAKPNESAAAKAEELLRLLESQIYTPDSDANPKRLEIEARLLALRERKSALEEEIARRNVAQPKVQTFDKDHWQALLDKLPQPGTEVLPGVTTKGYAMPASPDWRMVSVEVEGPSGRGIMLFGWDHTTGALANGNLIIREGDDIPGLDVGGKWGFAWPPSLSPDGRYLFAHASILRPGKGSDSKLLVLDRDPVSGSLSNARPYYEDFRNFPGLPGETGSFINAPFLSMDGRHALAFLQISGTEWMVVLDRNPATNEITATTRAIRVLITEIPGHPGVKWHFSGKYMPTFTPDMRWIFIPTSLGSDSGDITSMTLIPVSVRSPEVPSIPAGIFDRFSSAVPSSAASSIPAPVLGPLPYADADKSTDILIHNGIIYSAEEAEHQIRRYDIAGGRMLAPIDAGAFGMGSQDFNPRKMAVHDNALYILPQSGNQILTFDLAADRSGPPFDAPALMSVPAEADLENIFVRGSVLYVGTRSPPGRPRDRIFRYDLVQRTELPVNDRFGAVALAGYGRDLYVSIGHHVTIQDTIKNEQNSDSIRAREFMGPAQDEEIIDIVIHGAILYAIGDKSDIVMRYDILKEEHLPPLAPADFGGNLVDPKSLAVEGDTLYVVSSLSGEILRYDLKRAFPDRRERLVREIISRLHGRMWTYASGEQEFLDISRRDGRDGYELRLAHPDSPGAILGFIDEGLSPADFLAEVRDFLDRGPLDAQSQVILDDLGEFIRMEEAQASPPPAQVPAAPPPVSGPLVMPEQDRLRWLINQLVRIRIEDAAGTLSHEVFVNRGSMPGAIELDEFYEDQDHIYQYIITIGSDTTAQELLEFVLGNNEIRRLLQHPDFPMGPGILAALEAERGAPATSAEAPILAPATSPLLAELENLNREIALLESRRERWLRIEAMQRELVELRGAEELSPALEPEPVLEPGMTEEEIVEQLQKLGFMPVIEKTFRKELDRGYSLNANVPGPDRWHIWLAHEGQLEASLTWEDGRLIVLFGADAPITVPAPVNPLMNFHLHEAAETRFLVMLNGIIFQRLQAEPGFQWQHMTADGRVGIALFGRAPQAVQNVPQVSPLSNPGMTRDEMIQALVRAGFQRSVSDPNSYNREDGGKFGMTFPDPSSDSWELGYVIGTTPGALSWKNGVLSARFNTGDEVEIPAPTNPLTGLGFGAGTFLLLVTPEAHQAITSAFSPDSLDPQGHVGLHVFDPLPQLSPAATLNELGNRVIDALTSHPWTDREGNTMQITAEVSGPGLRLKFEYLQVGMVSLWQTWDEFNVPADPDGLLEAAVNVLYMPSSRELPVPAGGTAPREWKGANDTGQEMLRRIFAEVAVNMKYIQLMTDGSPEAAGLVYGLRKLADSAGSEYIDNVIVPDAVERLEVKIRESDDPFWHLSITDPTKLNIEIFGIMCTGDGFQVRMMDLDSVTFDTSEYAVSFPGNPVESWYYDEAAKTMRIVLKRDAYRLLRAQGFDRFISGTKNFRWVIEMGEPEEELVVVPVSPQPDPSVPPAPSAPAGMTREDMIQVLISGGFQPQSDDTSYVKTDGNRRWVVDLLPESDSWSFLYFRGIRPVVRCTWEGGDLQVRIGDDPAIRIPAPADPLTGVGLKPGMLLVALDPEIYSELQKNPNFNPSPAGNDGHIGLSFFGSIPIPPARTEEDLADRVVQGLTGQVWEDLDGNSLRAFITRKEGDYLLNWGFRERNDPSDLWVTLDSVRTTAAPDGLFRQVSQFIQAPFENSIVVGGQSRIVKWKGANQAGQEELNRQRSEIIANIEYLRLVAAGQPDVAEVVYGFRQMPGHRTVPEFKDSVADGSTSEEIKMSLWRLEILGTPGGWASSLDLFVFQFGLDQFDITIHNPETFNAEGHFSVPYTGNPFQSWYYDQALHTVRITLKPDAYDLLRTIHPDFNRFISGTKAFNWIIERGQLERGAVENLSLEEMGRKARLQMPMSVPVTDGTAYSSTPVGQGSDMEKITLMVLNNGWSVALSQGADLGLFIRWQSQRLTVAGKGVDVEIDVPSNPVYNLHFDPVANRLVIIFDAEVFDRLGLTKTSWETSHCEVVIERGPASTASPAADAISSPKPGPLPIEDSRIALLEARLQRALRIEGYYDELEDDPAPQAPQQGVAAVAVVRQADAEETLEDIRRDVLAFLNRTWPLKKGEEGAVAIQYFSHDDFVTRHQGHPQALEEECFIRVAKGPSARKRIVIEVKNEEPHHPDRIIGLLRSFYARVTALKKDAKGEIEDKIREVSGRIREAAAREVRRTIEFLEKEANGQEKRWIGTDERLGSVSAYATFKWVDGVDTLFIEVHHYGGGSFGWRCDHAGMFSSAIRAKVVKELEDHKFTLSPEALEELRRGPLPGALFIEKEEGKQGPEAVSSPKVAQRYDDIQALLGTSLRIERRELELDGVQERLAVPAEEPSPVVVLPMSSGVPARYPAPNFPAGLPVDQQGRVWFIDHGKQAVMSFDPASGEIRTLRGPKGIDFRPQNLAIDLRGRVWVVSPNSIAIYDPVKAVWRKVDISDALTHWTDFQFHGIAFDQSGRVWLTNGKYIFACDPDKVGEDLRWKIPAGWPVAGGVIKCQRPMGIIFDPKRQRMWVADPVAHRVHYIDTTGDRADWTGGSSGEEGASDPGKLDKPTGLFGDAQDLLWVLDGPRLHVYDPDADRWDVVSPNDFRTQSLLAEGLFFDEAFVKNYHQRQQASMGQDAAQASPVSVRLQALMQETIDWLNAQSWSNAVGNGEAKPTIKQDPQGNGDRRSISVHLDFTFLPGVVGPASWASTEKFQNPLELLRFVEELLKHPRARISPALGAFAPEVIRVMEERVESVRVQMADIALGTVLEVAEFLTGEWGLDNGEMLSHDVEIYMTRDEFRKGVNLALNDQREIVRSGDGNTEKTITYADLDPIFLLENFKVFPLSVGSKQQVEDKIAELRSRPRIPVPPEELLSIAFRQRQGAREHAQALRDELETLYDLEQLQLEQEDARREKQDLEGQFRLQIQGSTQGVATDDEMTGRLRWLARAQAELTDLIAARQDLLDNLENFKGLTALPADLRAEFMRRTLEFQERDRIAEFTREVLLDILQELERRISEARAGVEAAKPFSLIHNLKAAVLWGVPLALFVYFARDIFLDGSWTMKVMAGLAGVALAGGIYLIRAFFGLAAWSFSRYVAGPAGRTRVNRRVQERVQAVMRGSDREVEFSRLGGTGWTFAETTPDRVSFAEWLVTDIDWRSAKGNAVLAVGLWALQVVNVFLRALILPHVLAQELMRVRGHENSSIYFLSFLPSYYFIVAFVRYVFHWIIHGAHDISDAAASFVSRRQAARQTRSVHYLHGVAGRSELPPAHLLTFLHRFMAPERSLNDVSALFDPEGVRRASRAQAAEDRGRLDGWVRLLSEPSEGRSALLLAAEDQLLCGASVGQLLTMMAESYRRDAASFADAYPEFAKALAFALGYEMVGAEGDPARREAVEGLLAFSRTVIASLNVSLSRAGREVSFNETAFERAFFLGEQARAAQTGVSVVRPPQAGAADDGRSVEGIVFQISAEDLARPDESDALRTAALQLMAWRALSERNRSRFAFSVVSKDSTVNASEARAALQRHFRGTLGRGPLPQLHVPSASAVARMLDASGRFVRERVQNVLQQAVPGRRIGHVTAFALNHEDWAADALLTILPVRRVLSDILRDLKALEVISYNA